MRNPLSKLLRSIFQQLALLRQRRGFGFHVMTLMSGAAIAQLLTILLAPVLTRLYRPEDFAVLAVFSTVLFIFGPMVSARYELAIVPSRDNDEAFGLVVLSCIISIGVGVCLSILLRVPAIIRTLKAELFLKYLWILPVGVTVSGIYQAFRQYSIRRQSYRAISVSQVIQSSVSVCGQGIAAPIIHGWLGLVCGQLAGLTGSAISLRSGLRSEWNVWFRDHRKRVFATFCSLITAYKRYPIYLPWGGLIDAIAQRLPVLLLPVFYSANFLGMYAIADRLLRTPISLVGQASAQVLFQKMTQADVKARMPKVLITWAVMTTLLCLVPLAGLVYFGRFLFTFALGKAWASAATVSAALIPIYWGAIVVSPVSNLLIVADRQGLLLWIQLLLALAGFCSLWLAHYLLMTGTQAVLMYSVAQFVVYLVYFAVVFSVACKVSHQQRLAAIGEEVEPELQPATPQL